MPTSARRRSVSAPARAISASRARRGFTLVEIMVTIGIIILLVGILLPVIFRVRRQADRARTAADIQAISVALGAYKQDFGDIPRWTTDPVTTISTAPSGSWILGFALIAPGAQSVDGADGPGFRVRKTGYGQVYGPYLPPDKFKLSPTGSSAGGNQILDRNGMPFIYVPARVPAPDITIKDASTNKGNFDITNPHALYNVMNNDTALFEISGEGSITYAKQRIQYILGDNSAGLTGKNGIIDPGETPATTGEFIIWAAGPDRKFGFPDDAANSPPTAASVTDDVTNFHFAR